MAIMLRIFCCGCSLKTGTIILGVLNILGGVVNLISGISTATIAPLVNQNDGDAFVGLGAVLAVVGGILLLVSICLILGALNDNPKLLVSWMVYAIVFLVVNTTLYIAIAVLLFGTMFGFPFALLCLMLAVVYAWYEIYFLFVVYSLYRELKDPPPLPPTSNTTAINTAIYSISAHAVYPPQVTSRAREQPVYPPQMTSGARGQAAYPPILTSWSHDVNRNAGYREY